MAPRPRHLQDALEPDDHRPQAGAVYGRTSGPGQTTVPEQLRLCRRKCDDIGVPVRYVLHDDGLKAQDLDRPMFHRLLALASDGAIDAVVVWKLDRLVRSLTDLLKLHDAVRKSMGRDVPTRTIQYHLKKKALEKMVAQRGVTYDARCSLRASKRHLVEDTEFRDVARGPPIAEA